MDIVLVTWKDSHSWDDWNDLDNAEFIAKKADCTITTASFLLSQTEDRYVLCRSRTGSGSVDGVQVVLKSSVISIVFLSEKVRVE